MTNTSTKRALFSSVVSLFLCFVMLMGTTFAWFTDVATSSGNVIQAGTLDVQLLNYVDGQYVDISENSDPIFGKADSTTANEKTEDTLWEPGKTQTAYLCIKNSGTLDLKYKVAIEVTNISKNLHEVLEFVITPDAKGDAKIAKSDLDWEASDNRVVPGINIVSDEDVALKAGAEHYFALSVHMDEEAGNEYQKGNVTFNVKVLAGQLVSENDSFGNDYDTDAEYPEFNYYEIPTDPAAFEPAGYEIEIKNEKTQEKVGTMTFPATSLAEDATHVGGSIVETESYEGGNIQITSGYTARYYQVTASGLKSDNDVPVKVKIFIAEGLDPATFAVYHYEEALGVNDFSYNPETGYVTFSSATFSPFAITYDANSEYVAPEIPETPKLPVANVTNSPEYENVDLPWGSYGAWSPTVGLDNHLEGAYTFSVTETLEEAKANAFANWNCDFYVKLDRDLGVNQIFLGGNYGSFGWVGFHNGDLTLEANTELPLLGSVVSNAWTYVDVVQNVGTFICGVGDVNNALEGATFTVSLRLTNPDDETEFYNVAVVEHKFGAATKVGSQEELDNAFADENVDKIVLGDGEYTIPDSAKGKNVTIVGNGNTVVSVVDDGASEGDIDYSFEGSNVVFNNVTLNIKGSDHPGYARMSATYNNCTIKGSNYCLYGDSVFNNCTFNLDNGYVWTWGASNVEFNGCTFNGTNAKAILVHNTTETTVTVKNCTFNASTAASTWDGIAVAAVSIDPENGSPDATVYFEGTNTYSEAFNGLYQVKYADEVDDVKVYVNGELVEVPVGKN